MIEFRLLGVFEAARAGRILEIGSSKQRRLLALLVVNLNQPVSRDALFEELWDGRPPASAVTTAQGLASRLRRVLTDAHDAAGDATLRSRGTGSGDARRC